MNTGAGPSGGRRRVVLDADAYVDGVLRGDRALLGRAITLMESRRAEHRALAEQVLERLLPHTGRALRVGVSGAPGAGKSTFIEAFGTKLTGLGHKVAVLAIDPSSVVSGGSILGDKTRMTALAQDPRAFVRPSPSGLTLGGVARHTREVMLVVEAAGFDVVLVETVGVGQSEVLVAEMVDVFLVLMIAGGGDELQGIKRGILELADVVAVSKADGDNAAAAERAAAAYGAALRYLRPRHAHWQPRATTISSVSGAGVDALWDTLRAHHAALAERGALAALRAEQDVRWMRALVEEELVSALRASPRVVAALDAARADVAAHRASPARAADRVLAAFADAVARGEALGRP